MMSGTGLIHKHEAEIVSSLNRPGTIVSAYHDINFNSPLYTSCVQSSFFLRHSGGLG